MANVKIELNGENTGSLLVKLYGAEEYRAIESEWEVTLDAEAHAEFINDLFTEATAKGIRVFATVEDDGDDVIFEVAPLVNYEKRGGEYSDAGNGGEAVDKVDFDLAFFVEHNASDVDPAELLESTFDYTFWSDSVTGFYLRHK